MNNLILALLLAGLYCVAANVQAQQTYGYSNADSDASLWQYSRARPRLLGHEITRHWNESNGAGAIPACSLSFEDRQQLEEFLEGY